MEIIEETDEDRQERIQKWRLHRALREAPDLLAHVRSIAVSGRSERGETLGEWTAPMRITATDHMDEVYADLIGWVLVLAAELRLSPPSTAVVAWSLRYTDLQDHEKVLGFRAEATVEGVRLLTSLQTMWLLIHEDQIEASVQYPAFRDAVLKSLWDLRSHHPMQPRRTAKPTHARECPACGEPAVTASWFSQQMRDVDVVCGECGYRIETKAKQLDALDWETRENQECTCLYPGDPLSDCPVHHPDTTVEVAS